MHFNPSFSADKIVSPLCGKRDADFFDRQRLTFKKPCQAGL
jgi:hypothetical protein